MIADIHLAAEHDTPEIEFRFARHYLAIRGESYPENANQFYKPLIAALGAYLAVTENVQINVDVDLVYFNSSSTKALLDMFGMLDAAGERNRIAVSWYYDPDDDSIREFGADIAEDCHALTYRPLEKVV